MKLTKKIFALLVAFTFVFATFLLPVSVQAAVYKGADVYEYDNISDYQQFKDSGVQVVIQKATEGLTHNDSLLQYRAAMLAKYGFKVGYYHYADNTGFPVDEAKHFINQIRGLHSDTVLWLDIENESDWTKAEAIDYVNQFINYVQSQNYKVGIYTGLSFYYEYLQGGIPNVPIWLASYGKQPLQYPGVVSWQFSSTGRLNGVIGNIDLDSFNDSIFTGQAPAATQNVQVTATVIKDSKTASLQSNLAELLQWNISVDGIPGPQTEGATKQFQSMVNITVDGVPGPQTNSAINQILAKPTIRIGSSGIAVRYLQYRIGIKASGNFDEQTRLAVVDFEKKHNLKVDKGIVGNQIWNELLKQL